MDRLLNVSIGDWLLVVSVSVIVYAVVSMVRDLRALGSRRARRSRILVAQIERQLDVTLAELNAALAQQSIDWNERSMQLLWSHLTPEQQTMAMEKKMFSVVGNATGTVYYIKLTGKLANVWTMDGKRLCFLPTLEDGERLPYGDILLTQKIMLETSEKRVCRIAGWT